MCKPVVVAVGFISVDEVILKGLIVICYQRSQVKLCTVTGTFDLRDFAFLYESKEFRVLS
jgi:hypothetical protein